MTRTRVVLGAVIAVGLLVIAGATGYLMRSGASSAVPSASSVDAGFARDMSVHHNQAIEMAGYTRDDTSDPAIRVLATDIETEQYFEYGEMQGWLTSWNLLPSSPLKQMSWMSGHDHILSNGLMPGMATEPELNTLETLKGTALDVEFLQLMIRHHQGGIPMAQYAADNATTPYVKNLATKMVATQTGEVVQMEQLLRARGGTPLAAPAS